jgi:hypothetical protein
MQPFNAKTVYTILLGAVCYTICYFVFHNCQGFGGIFLRSIVFVLLYATGVLYLDLSPDVLPVWETLKKRLQLK